MKEKAQKRQEQDRILNQDVNKLPQALRSTFEIYQAQVLKEWKNDGLFGKVFTSSDDDKMKNHGRHNDVITNVSKGGQH
ncbi:hypothetical protein Ddye_007613 [Dipteronia dyeriana]|uniref:Uncharacterized protein n=1 Tax=Dipteronia dyeriana TaxID=168575 RepID=A0AAD9XKC3_9ROSI|nr:hypothetical protein Ddye_007613 [Dipteronia dyeriana]